MKKLYFFFIFLSIPVLVFASTTTDSTSTLPTEPLETPIIEPDGGPFLPLGGGGEGFIFFEDFNDLNNGNLTGQNAWTGNVTYQVEDTTVFEGEKAVENGDNSDSLKDITKTGDLIETGQLTIYLRKTTLNGSWRVHLSETVPNIRVTLFMGLASDGKFSYFNSSIDTVYINIGTTGSPNFAINTWYVVQFAWYGTGVDSLVKYRVYENGQEEGDWTEYVKPFANWVNGLDTVLLRHRLAIGQGINYCDYIAENPYEEGPPPPPVENYLTNTFYSFWYAFSEYFFALWGCAIFGSILLSLVFLTTKR